MARPGPHNDPLPPSAAPSLVPLIAPTEWPRTSEVSCLEELEFDFNANLHAHRLPILQRRIKTPLPHSLYRLCIQPEPKPVDDTNVSRLSSCVDDQEQRARALRLRPAGFLCVLRIRRQHRLRGRYSATDLKHASTDSATAPGTDTCAVSNSYTAARTESNPAAGTRSIGRRGTGQSGSGWITQVGHVIFGKVHLGRHNDCRFYRQLGIRVAKHNLRRSDLHHRELGESPSRRGQRITIPTASTTTDHFAGRPKYVGVRGRCNEEYDLSLLGLYDDLMSDGSARKDEA